MAQKAPTAEKPPRRPKDYAAKSTVAANASDRPWDLIDELTARQVLAPNEALSARRAAERAKISQTQVLVTRRLADPETIAQGQAAILGVQHVDLVRFPPEKSLMQDFHPSQALQLGVLPWRRAGRATLIAAPSRGTFEAALPELSRHFEAPRLVVTARPAITAAIERWHRGTLVRRAETRPAAADSCRTLVLPGVQNYAFLAVALGVFLLCAVPTLVFAALCGVALATLVATLLLKLAAAAVTMREAPPSQEPPYLSLRLEEVPRISILVALYKETDITAHLLDRLQKLNYPREHMEVLLITESDDLTTQETIAGAELPSWMRQVTVPPGQVKTKPRALNYALDQCQGDIIGVYDAEDAPEPDQLLTVAARFAEAPPDVACLQGRLDFYNASANWMARCFALEYATWFRVVLPGLAKLRLPVPLGGTTLFFRRDALEALGGWDAHNVTEDADLGLRLTRRGYRTELVDTVTYEEANCRPWPWVRQRSRWLKGYAVTYAVHMRNPLALWRDLGLRGFLGVQVLFACTLAQFVLAPLLWSFWAVFFGLPHPLDGVLGPTAVLSLSALFLLAEIVGLGVATLGATRTKHRKLWHWAPTLMAYFPLGTLAAYKAIYELFGQPFYWDKTTHGLSQATNDLHLHAEGLGLTLPPHVSSASPKPHSGAA